MGMDPSGVKTGFFTRLLLAAGLWSGWVCRSSSIPALSGEGGSELLPAAPGRGPLAGGVQEQGCVWAARRAEQIPAVA